MALLPCGHEELSYIPQRRGIFRRHGFHVRGVSLARNDDLTKTYFITAKLCGSLGRAGGLDEEIIFS
jgi:hypothetical protein